MSRYLSSDLAVAQEERSPIRVASREPHPEERGLLSDCQKGDPEAYGKIVQCHQARVYSFVLRMVRDAALAEDLTQEAFIRGFVKIRLFDLERRFLPWIFRIAANLVRNYMKSPARREVARPPEELAGRSDSRDDPSEALIRKRRLALVERALVELPEKYRAALLLKQVEGFSYKEISEVLGVSVWALKMRVSRSRKRLRARVDELEEEGRK